MTTPITDRAAIGLLRVLPRKLVTRAAGWAAERTVPTALRAPLYRAFANAVGANLAEAADPLDSFPRFNAFFTRELKPDARPWSAPPTHWAMPADGRLSEHGRVTSGRMLQVKGIDYPVQHLLGVDDPAPWEGARYATVYLSPADYHRVHNPAAVVVTSVRRLGGELWPVNRLSASNIPELYVRNERSVTLVRDARGRQGAIVMVGATVVGGIELAAESPDTQPSGGFAAGSEHGRFLLGSTVVLVLQDREHPLDDTTLRAGDPVRLGQPLWPERS